MPREWAVAAIYKERLDMSRLPKQHIAIPANRSMLLIDETATRAGTESLRVSLEQESAILTLNVTAVEKDKRLDMIVYEVSQDSEDEILLHRLPSVTRASEPLQITVTPGGSFRIVIERTGTATYTVRGKSVSSLPVVPIDVIGTAEEADRQTKIINLLMCNNDLLEKLVNHMRYISGLESDEGDNY
jgi:hypothetical protein